MAFLDNPVRFASLSISTSLVSAGADRPFGGKLVDIVSIGDVVKHRMEDLELETNVLRDVYNAAR